MSHSLILYQRITGDFYTIISEGKFTLSTFRVGVSPAEKTWYNDCTMCNPDRSRGLPRFAGLMPEATAWKVNAASAALPFLRMWYNDCTMCNPDHTYMEDR